MKTETYTYQQTQLPTEGQYIIAGTTPESIFVYQAYKAAIAQYAIEYQRFGGPHFSMDRMTWIKPNFMWMMYRSGWAQKKDQERILQLELSQAGFRAMLAEAVPSSFSPGYHQERSEWDAAIQNSNVRLQWDPDHAPDGSKLPRRAIQLGVRGSTFQNFNDNYLLSVRDITDFVLQQRLNIGQPDLLVPVERVVDFSTYPEIVKRIGLSPG